MLTRFGSDEKVLLLEKDLKSVDDGPELSPIWTFCQWLFVFVGGSTFVAGSVFLFFPNAPNGADWSALLYTIGSISLLNVDIMEFVTLSDVWIRVNSFCSLVASSFFLVGSIGFFPEVRRMNIIPCAWCFTLGSIIAGASQMWKIYRVSKGRTGRFHIANLIVEGFTELIVGVGVWCFFFGSVMYLIGPHKGPWYFDVSVFWTGGSCFFLLAALVLGFRLFVINI